MKNKEFLKKLIIAVTFMALVALGVLCEFGIANLFGIHFEGMPYKEYVIQYFTNHPWFLYGELVLTVIGIIVWTEVEYQGIDDLYHKIKLELKQK